MFYTFVFVIDRYYIKAISISSYDNSADNFMWIQSISSITPSVTVSIKKIKVKFDADNNKFIVKVRAEVCSHFAVSSNWTTVDGDDEGKF